MTPSNSPKSASANPNPTALDRAFEALKTYDRGSSRAVLQPLDEAVAASSPIPSQRKDLERRFLVHFEDQLSVVAREYIGAKLAIVGGAASARALAAWLADPRLATTARNAFEVMPGRTAAKVLCQSLARLSGREKAGVINSLGARRDLASVRSLIPLLEDADPEIVTAAVAALGRIGSAKAASALRQHLPNAPAALRQHFADAALNCAEVSLTDGRKADAQALYRTVAQAGWPAHVQAAAARGLRACG